MASSARNRHRTCHVLDFLCDDDYSSALTILENGVRFHIIANAQKFNIEDISGPAGRLSRRYMELARAFQVKEKSEQDVVEKKGCTSDSPISENSAKDSAVDVGEAEQEERKSGFELEGVDVEKEVQNLMLSPFGDIFDELAPPLNESTNRSIYEWYNCDTHFFDLDVDENGEFSATELEATSELEDRMRLLMPRIDIPKYIRQLDIPRFSVHDLTVIAESDDPGPYHPIIVKANDGEEFFLKVAVTAYPGPTKREIKLLREIEKKGLHDQFHVPQIQGLVYTDEKSPQILGFLQTPIKSPTPLTSLLDEDVSQRKRDRWAKEVQRIISLLHDNDIIWGDAKADNFVVDEDDELWIIDFGGSFTDGWVDPEIAETEEGDDMGAEKIVNALHDPVANTEDPADIPYTPSEERVKKRKAVTFQNEDEGDTEVDTDNESAGKKRKKMKGSFYGEERYCFCEGVESDSMIACDNEDCGRKWFHFECVGLTEAPATNEQWFCSECE